METELLLGKAGYKKIFELTVPGRCFLTNQAYAKTHWQRKKIRDEVKEDTQSALQAIGIDLRTLTD